MCSHHIVAQGVSVRVSFHPHAIRDVMCFERSLVVPCLSLLFLSFFYFFSSLFYLFSVLHNLHNVVTAEG